MEETNQKIQQQIKLPFIKAVEIAWKNIRVRWLRSLIVTSGIVLSISFLMYMLSSEAVLRQFIQKGSPKVIEQLQKEGKLYDADNKDSKMQIWWMVGLALIVSFVGILNAMLMSIAERFAEIGTMKCLGALGSFILRLFLLESAFQGMVGTAIGIVIGLALALTEGFYSYGAEVVTILPVAYLIRLACACLFVGTLITIAGALYPAWKASKMDPVEAMRWEA